MGGMKAPPSYKPDFIDQTVKLCRLGATDVELAEFFGVSTKTLYEWKRDNEDFAKAVTVGKDHSDNRVERSLYNKALGYDVYEEQAVKVKDPDGSERVEIVQVKKHIPPDTTSAIFWLKNRRRKDWSDRKDIVIDGNLRVEHKTLDPALLTDDQRILLREALQQAMLSPPVDGEYEEVN
jgi:hypothetical protein